MKLMKVSYFVPIEESSFAVDGQETPDTQTIAKIIAERGDYKDSIVEAASDFETSDYVANMEKVKQAQEAARIQKEKDERNIGLKPGDVGYVD